MLRLVNEHFENFWDVFSTIHLKFLRQSSSHFHGIMKLFSVSAI
eukprot:UN19138